MDQRASEMAKYEKSLFEMLPELIGGDKEALSTKEIATATGRNTGAVGKIIKALHEQRVIHVSAWRRSHGSHTALWKIGSLPDAAPLEKLTNAETCRRYVSTERGRKIHNKGSRRWYRQNNGAEAKRLWRKNKEALKTFETGGVAAIDPLLAAIMGYK